MGENRKILKGRIWLILAAVCILLSGCRKKTGGQAVSGIRSAGVLRVAVSTGGQNRAAEEVLSFRERKLATMLAEALNVQLTFNGYEDVSAALSAVSSGEADLAAGGITDGTVSPEQFAISDPYEKAALYVVTAYGDYSNSPASFEGRSLGYSAAVSGVSDQLLTKESGIISIPSAGYSDEDITGALENREMNGYLCLRDEGLRLVKTGRSVQLQNVLGTEPLQFVLAADKNAADLIQGADRLIPQKAAQEESEGSGYSEGNSYSGESEGAAEAGVPGSTDTAEMSGNMQDNTADGTGAVQTSDKKSGFPAAILLTLLPVLFIIAFWKLFAKAGEAGWKSLVPFLNLYILYKISWGKGILFLLGFIPFVNIIIYFMTMLKLGDAFEKKLPFKLGLLFLPNVFMLILGFDHSEYLGSGHKS